MLRAVKLATLALCAAAALSPSTPAHAQDLQTWLFAEGSTSAVLGFEEELLLGNPHVSDVAVTAICGLTHRTEMARTHLSLTSSRKVAPA